MPINEIDAFCIALPADLCPFTEPDHLRYLCVIGHASAANPNKVEYRTLGRGFSTEPASAVIRRVCSELAIETVDATRVVRGHPIPPEAYIERWRERLTGAIRLDRLVLDKELRAVAIFEWAHEPRFADKKPRWVKAPFESFGELLASRQFEPAPAGYLTRLEIDLAEPNGARDAWWADDFLSAVDRAKNLVDVRIELRRTHRQEQPTHRHTQQPRMTHVIANF